VDSSPFEDSDLLPLVQTAMLTTQVGHEIQLHRPPCSPSIENRGDCGLDKVVVLSLMILVGLVILLCVFPHNTVDGNGSMSKREISIAFMCTPFTVLEL